MPPKTSEHLRRLRDAREHAQTASSRRNVDYILGRKFENGENDFEYEYGKLSFKTALIFNEFTEILSSNITSLINDVTQGEKRIVEFDIRYSNHNRTPIQYLKLDSLPSFAKLQPISTGEIELPQTTYEEDQDNLKIKVIRVKAPGGDSVLGIQEYYSTYMLGSTMWARIIKEGGQDHYDRFEKQVIGIPEDVRAIAYDGYLYSDSPKALERIFDFEQEYKEEVNDVISGFSSRDIELDLDPDLMDTLTSDIRHLRKFHEIRELGIHEKATHESLQRIVAERDLPIKIRSDNGTMILSVESGNDRWHLLDLLADDHVVSEMTGNPYNAEGKELVD